MNIFHGLPCHCFASPTRAAAQTLVGLSLLSLAAATPVKMGWAQNAAGMVSVFRAIDATAETTVMAETVYNGPLYVPGEVLVGVLPRERGTAPDRSSVIGGGNSPVGDGSTKDAGMTARQKVETLSGVSILSQNEPLGVFRLRLTSGETVEQAIARIKASGQVSYAEPNYIRYAFSTPNDPNFTQNQWGPAKVNAPQAWDIYNPKIQTVIAIIDTGITLSHPDLAGKILKDGSGNVVGYNFINQTPNPIDDHGHGTHCAGIAAAQINNGVGVAGIAGWSGVAGQTDVNSTKIMPVKVLDAGGSGSDDGIINGMVWAADHGARVLSMSLGGVYPSQSLTSAVNYAIGKNCVVVAASGNSGLLAVTYPAGCAGVLSVASSDTSDGLSSFSNYGSWVTVAAPGRGILSTWLDPNTPYAALSGTSMATPLVAGEVALLASQNPSLTSAQLFALVKNNTDPLTQTTSRTIGSGGSGGRVNVYKALLAASPVNLAAPAGASALATSRTAVTLAWQDNSEGEDGFSVEMSTNGTTFSVLGAAGMNKTTVVVSGLSRSTTYYFRLRAFSGAATSPYSNTVSAKTKAF